MNKTKIIIGAGLGGLVHGILHKKARPNDKVVIYDLNKIPGGFCTAFKKASTYNDEKVVYTVNIPLITSDFEDGHPLAQFMEYLGVEKINWRVVENLFEYYPLDEKPFVLKRNGIEDLIDLAKTEKEKDSLRKFFHKMKELYNDLMKKSQVNPEPLDKLKLLFKIPKTIFTVLTDKPYLDTINSYGIKTKTIKEILCCAEAFMGVEADIVTTVGELAMIQSFLENTALQPHNGDTFQTLSDNLAKRFKDLGGELILGTKVDELVFEKDRAIGIKIGNEIIKADTVILSVAQDCVKNLVKKGDYIPSIKKLIKNIDKLPPNSDYYCYYLIDKKVVEEKPELLNTAYHIYRLPDNNDIDNWKLPIWVPDELINGKYYVLTLIVTEKDQQKVDWWIDLRKKDYKQYNIEKEKVAQKFLEVLQNVEPIFKKHPPLKHLMTMTPASYLPYGSKYPIAGLAQTPNNFGLKRMMPYVCDNVFISSNANFSCGVWGAIAGSWQGFVASYEKEFGVKIGNHDILFNPDLNNLP